MRILFLTALLAFLASAALADESRPSQTMCDANKIGARELADCLRIAADKSDKELMATLEAAIASVTRALAATDDPVLAGELVAERRSLREDLAELERGAGVVHLADERARRR